MRYKHLLPVALPLSKLYQRYPVHVAEQTRAPQMVHVIGSGRNGSTMLGAMLNRHENLVVVPEQFFLYLSYIRFRLFGFRSWASLVKLIFETAEKPNKTASWGVSFSPHLEEVSNWPKSDQTFRNLMDFMYGVYRDKQGANKLIIDKTPLNTRHIDLLLEVYPESKFIFLNRDGRAVVSSYMQGSKEVFQEVFGLVPASHFWNHSVTAWDRVKTAVPKANTFEISYEQLVSSPEESAQKLCSFLGVEYINTILNPHESTDSMGTNQYEHHSNVHKPLSSAGMDKWKTKLSEAEVAQIESIIGGNLERFGYK